MLVCAGLLLLQACDRPRDSAAKSFPDEPDPHSFARPHEVRVEHIELDLTIDFEARQIRGRAGLQIVNPGSSPELWLDTWGLDIKRVTLDQDENEASYVLGRERQYLGRPLVVQVRSSTEVVHVEYATGPDAIALQWLEPQQTAGGRRPFLLTQSQSVFARTWIPCQDSPAIRATYEATVRVPEGLLALMSAENPRQLSADGVYRFRMPQPIPAYLMALAVGELEFRELGSRSGVYAEPTVVERAAWEFAETEQMLVAAEQLYGPYRWGRFDLIVLPASFPFGGMENPRLTFLTPTLLAGDRSLVATIAHELAHSWSGNLVTNANWGDFWLNEGFTVYFEKRIMEAVYGRDYSEMLATLDRRQLVERIEALGPDNPLTALHVELEGQDPEDSFSVVAYEKGYLFLRLLEERLGREEWDAFLRIYFDSHAFGTMTSDRFVAYLRKELIALRDDGGTLEAALGIDEWVYRPGLPQNAPPIESEPLERVDTRREKWLAGSPAASLATDGWSAHHYLQFVRGLPESLPADRLAELDAAFGLSESGNAEIRFAWLLRTIGAGYPPADESLESFLREIGRLKFLAPLYTRLAATPEGLVRARRIYEAARPGYHAISRSEIDRTLDPDAD